MFLACPRKLLTLWGRVEQRSEDSILISGLEIGMRVKFSIKLDVMGFRHIVKRWWIQVFVEDFIGHVPRSGGY